MNLSALLEGVPVEAWHGDRETPVDGVAYHSGRVRPGTVFCTWRGTGQDGHRFIPQALERGASALVVETRTGDYACPTVVVPSGRRALSLMAANLMGHPAEALLMAGVTGTNGKTSTAYLLRHLLGKMGRKCGMLGTVEYDLGREAVPATRTTPEGLDLQEYLAAMRDNGCTACAMEVSSHALALERAAGIRFQAAILTNFTQDHLDFHGTMDDYFLAKARLFEGLEQGAVAVLNSDDPCWERMLKHLRPGIEFITYGCETGADHRAEDIILSADHTSFTWVTGGDRIPVRAPWIGRFNVYNLLAAAATAAGLGAAPADVAAWLATAPAVPGRMEPVANDKGITVLVDYAHTDDALTKVLQTLRPLTKGRLLVVAGCGGDRDRTKRPLMARAACSGADTAFFTSDNPRGEEPEAILRDMVRGVEGAKNFQVITGRREAISAALHSAKPGDVVVLAGKGHEATQEIAGVKHPFSDRQVAQEILQGRSA